MSDFENTVRVTWSLASRPKPGEYYCGDAGLVVEQGDSLLVALVDGVGHGEPAHKAAQACVGFTKRVAKHSLIDIFHGVNRFLQGSRGVVMSLARINLTANTLQYMGVGNITACLVGDRSKRFVNQNGILGADTDINPLMQNEPFHPQTDLFFMSSDGVDEQLVYSVYHPKYFAGFQPLVDSILDDWAHRNDDASVMVVGCPSN